MIYERATPWLAHFWSIVLTHQGATENPNTIITLSPADEYGLALEACRLEHNKDRYLPPFRFLDDGPSRAVTPADSEISNTSIDSLEHLHRIILDFRQQFKSPGRICVGSDPRLCDVLLTSKRRQLNISGLHFYVSFDHQYRLVVEDVSSGGTIVSYGKQAKHQRRHHFPWTLLSDYGEIIITIPQKKAKTKLAFRVHFPNRDDWYEEYYQIKAAEFMAKAQGARGVLSILDRLALPSCETSIAPSEALSPNHRPVYLDGETLGEGAFARVFSVVDVSTCHEYAAKEFFRQEGWLREVNMLRNIRHVRLTKTFLF